VNYLKEFQIPFKGLNIGVHNYKWEISHKFFEAIDNSDIDDAAIEVELDLEKQERLMICNFNITGSVFVKCDRCLDRLELPVNTTETLYIKFGAETEEDSDDVLYIAETEYQIDIGSLINEFITLSLPLKKVHLSDENDGDGCNLEIIRKLEELSGKNNVDPRWEKLKNLKLDK
jgi:uncharacterized metal-binding protein YceD (DUF177 family)